MGKATPQLGVLFFTYRPLNAIPFKGNLARFTPSLEDYIALWSIYRVRTGTYNPAPALPAP